MLLDDDRPMFKVFFNVRDMLGSLFSTSTGRPLHLIMLTDAQSKNKVEESVVQSIGQFLSGQPEKIYIICGEFRLIKFESSLNFFYEFK